MRHWFEGTSPFPAVALIVFLLGCGFLLADLLSPSTLLWTGRPVRGTEHGGIVYYSFRGQSYTLDDPATAHVKSRTVYVDASNPSNAMLDNSVNRAVDIATVGGSYGITVLLFAAGFARRAHRRRKRRPEGRSGYRGSFGDGLDPGTVARLLAGQRQGVVGPDGGAPEGGEPKQPR
jgi:hypothetical protein